MLTLGPRNRGTHLDKCSSVNIKTNLFKVDFKQETKIFIYSVQTQPEIPFENNKKVRSILIKSRKIIERLIGTFTMSGRTVFGTKLQECGRGGELNFKIEYEGDYYFIVLKLVKEVALSDVHSHDRRKSGIAYHFLNNLVKNFFHQIGYTEIGKSGKYFDARHYNNLTSAKVIVFKGYSSHFSLLEEGLFLRIDPSVKVVRQETVLDVIDIIYNRHKGLSKLEKRNMVEKELIGKQIMTNYGKNMYYYIDSVLFDTPLDSYFFYKGLEKINLT